jgi:Fe-S cluster assembly protein SufD
MGRRRLDPGGVPALLALDLGQDQAQELRRSVAASTQVLLPLHMTASASSPAPSFSETALQRLGLSEPITDLVPSVPMPTTDAEVWRYSRIGRVRVAGLPVAPAGATPLDLPSAIGQSCGTVVTVDGHVVRIELSPEALAAGLRVVSSAADPSVGFAPVVVDGGDTLVDLTQAAATDTLIIDVPRGATIPGTLQLIHQVVTPGAYIPSRLLVRVAETAAFSMVERVIGDAAGSVFTPLTELHVGDAATLRFVSVQELGAHTIQLAHQQATTGRDATLRSMSVALGGSYARVRTDAVITGQGGFNELLAVYFGAGEQMHDFRTLQHHIAPRTTSELLFKGAVEDSSQSVYSGLIRIGVDAKQTVANQANRNLLLSPTATAESVPNLEIENNDVKCSHASAVGPVDEDHRYYLGLRGVPPDEAERLIVVGFFRDVLDRSPIAGVSDQLADVFADKFTARTDARTAAGSAAGSVR